MRVIRFFILFFLVVSGFSKAVYAQNEPKAIKNNLIKDLNDIFLVYDNEYETYVPFVRSEHQNFNTLNCWLSKSEYSGYVLSFTSSPELCLFINQKLYGFYNDVRQVEINLSRIDLSRNSKELFITFYHPASAYNALKNPQLIYKQPVDAVVYKEKNVAPTYALMQRASSPIESWIVICFVALVAVYVLIRNVAPTLFFSFFTFDNVASGSLDEYSSAIKKGWSREIFLFIIANSLTLGFVLLLVQPGQSAGDQFSTGSFSSIFQFLGYYLQYVGFGLLYFLFKFSLLYFLGYMFKINVVTNAHYYEFIRFSTISSVLLLLFTFMQYNSLYLSYDHFLKIAVYLILGLIILRIMKIALVLNSSISFRNLYLFSYLCATEIIPILIIAKYYKFD